METFNSSNGSRSGLSPHTNHVNFITDLAFALFDGTCDDSSSSWDVDGLIDGHEKGLVFLSFGNLNVII